MMPLLLRSSVAFFSSFLAKYVKNKDVITYITPNIIHLYHIPSVTFVPAAIDAVPIVSGLVMAVVNPTPDAIKINDIAVKLDQFNTVHSIANTGNKTKVKAYSGYRHEIHNEIELRNEVEDAMIEFINGCI